MKELREKAEKFAFQAEVSRMMKLIINSLYRNKEVRKVLQNFLAMFLFSVSPFLGLVPIPIAGFGKKIKLTSSLPFEHVCIFQI